MSRQRKGWIAFSVALTVASGGLALALPKGPAITTFGDITAFLLLALATGVTAVTAVQNGGHTRSFWALISLSCLLWTINQAGWTFYEVFLRRDLPDPFLGDIILFVHVVPLMAAVSLRPHRAQGDQKLYFGTLNFLMLLIWWIFLYAFIIFPDEYVQLNVSVYSHRYDILYLIENLLLLGSLATLAWTTAGAWRKIYWNLFIAMGIYTFASEVMNAAIAREQYYSGSLYDAVFIGAVCWLIGTGLMAREMKPGADPKPAVRSRWQAVPPYLAMIAMLSLPVMGFWELFFDNTSARLRAFRVLVTLISMLVLGVCVFARQYLLDRELVRLLRESHDSVETLQRLQSQLVQKEKLASLGQLVAGAAHEINNPLTAILGYSEMLATTSSLTSEQTSMANKIGQQARRTRDLVSGLLSFAQQARSEKKLVDISSLIERALQGETKRLEGKGIRVQKQLGKDLPMIWGNANQLFQCCQQIIMNAADALDEVGGGTLSVNTYGDEREVVLEFLDTGPGIREPRRVFDPFYTTKPVGKGTGMGLSATYGVIQDHRAHISCHNREEGGAIFVLRFPTASQIGSLEASAANTSL